MGKMGDSRVQKVKSENKDFYFLHPRIAHFPHFFDCEGVLKAVTARRPFSSFFDREDGRGAATPHPLELFFFRKTEIPETPEKK